MKRYLTALIAITVGMGMADAKTLVAYYSRSGNTMELANEIARQVGADTYRIETADANWYPDEYRPTTEQAKKEIADGTLPPIKEIINLTEYDTVFIGTPCWWGTVAIPVKTFLSQANLDNKTIVPFNTHEGSGTCGHSDIVSATPNSKHLDGLTVRGSNASDAAENVKEWLGRIGLAK